MRSGTCVLWCNSRLEKTVQPIVSLVLVPCERIHSAGQTYHSSPLLVAPGLKAAGAYRPAALVHLSPLHAPEDHSPPFVIGKHVEELVCASRDKDRGGEKQRCKNQQFALKTWVLIRFAFPRADAAFCWMSYCVQRFPAVCWMVKQPTMQRGKVGWYLWHDIHGVIINPLTTVVSHTPMWNLSHYTLKTIFKYPHSTGILMNGLSHALGW